MSEDRMQEHTADEVAERIDRRTREHVRKAAGTGGLDERLAEIDREWDLERVLFVVSGVVVLAGTALAHRVSAKWAALPAVVAAFQIQHGMQGWCPPMAVLRRLKVRTRSEIDDERTALKMLRGDFVTADRSPDHAVDLARS